MRHAGQAQKELFHNEALLRLDLLVQAAVIDTGRNTPPTAPDIGDAHLIGTAPVAGWAGHAGALAGWTDGGWRFVDPIEGLRCWSIADGLWFERRGGQWLAGEVVAQRVTIGGDQVLGARGTAIPPPIGGDVVDAPARAAISAILSALAMHGLIEPAPG